LGDRFAALLLLLPLPLLLLLMLLLRVLPPLLLLLMGEAATATAGTSASTTTAAFIPAASSCIGSPFQPASRAAKGLYKTPHKCGKARQRHKRVNKWLEMRWWHFQLSKNPFPGHSTAISRGNHSDLQLGVPQTATMSGLAPPPVGLAPIYQRRGHVAGTQRRGMEVFAVFLRV
jgi:hypothetical protein